MNGLMHNWPLLIKTLINHANDWHGETEIVSQTVEGAIDRYTYADLHRRSRMLSSALCRELGVRRGDIIGTMAWNGYRHMEVWYGVMGIGAIVNTLNPRLFSQQLSYIVRHSGCSWIFVDADLFDIVDALSAEIPSVKGIVVMTDRQHLPGHSSGRNIICYEDLLASGQPEFEWGVFDEYTASSLCYTSGTTGDPKGVLYSHRSTVLHAMASSGADAYSISSQDVIMPIAPMFHANGWATAFIGPMVGAKMVMPGSKLDGESVYRLLEQEKVTWSAAVPTVWRILLDYLDKNPKLRLNSLKRIAVGGSACPQNITREYEDRYGVDVINSWGMTEMSPLGVIGTRKGGYRSISDADWQNLKLKQGRPIFTVEMKITNDEGSTIPRDGKTAGVLKTRGPGVASAYFNSPNTEGFDVDGWFNTGDIATIDRFGYMKITDRAKDIIKSGGEWISSSEIEILVTRLDIVAEAAVIGIFHPKWDERPILVIRLAEGEVMDKDQIIDYLTGRVAKWWIPDDVIFVKEMPHNATGKISKKALREMFSDYRLPAV